jgi:hypothetical protein
MTTTNATQRLAALHAGELQPILAELEQQRQRTRTRALLACAALVPIVLIALVATRWIGTFGLVLAGILGVVVWGLITSGPIKAYRSHFKQEILSRLVALVDPGLSYSADSGIDIGTFRASAIFRRDIDRYRCEDLFVGAVGATAFRFSEVHAEYKTTSTDSKGRRRTTWHTIFRGVFFVADFNKHFQGQTFVLPDTAESMMGGLGRWFQEVGGKLDSRPGELVSLEDPEFERLFVVHATDQVEARYILSPSLMERLVELRSQAEGNIAVSFVSSSIFLAISSSKNRFEPPSIWAGSAELSLDDLRRYMSDVRLAEELVNDLNLNTRIWSKQ